MPMWCSSADNAYDRSRIPEPHHRIVRIPPGEAVVLNSAERAPYLLLIEILSGDLDFDPAKRSNKEILRKLVNKEVEQRGNWLDFGLTSASLPKDTPEISSRTPVTSILHTPYFNATPSTARPPTTAFSNDDEEIDLVEQLFGDDQPLRSRTLDIEDSIVLPPTPKNRDLDMATWARSSPLIEESRSGQFGPHHRSPSLSRTHSASPSQSQINTNDGDTGRVLSLDEYSERMRTAAIMLAQLNADSGPANFSPKVNGSPRPDSTIDRPSELLSLNSEDFTNRSLLQTAERLSSQPPTGRDSLALLLCLFSSPGGGERRLRTGCRPPPPQTAPDSRGAAAMTLRRPLLLD